MEQDIQAVKAPFSDLEITDEEVAERLSVAPSELYRHLPGERSTVKMHS